MSDTLFADSRMGAGYRGTFAPCTLLAVVIALSICGFPIKPAEVAVHAYPHRTIRQPRFFFIPAPPEPSAFDEEQTMSPRDLIQRWRPFIAEASKRFGVPESWIRAVIRQESGGRTMMAGNQPITSKAGAVGVMQVMPDTYAEARGAFHLGVDPCDPHDNIIAGTAYLQWLHSKYGFPNMFAAYNDGPGNFDQYLAGKRTMPAETVSYLADLSAALGPAKSRSGHSRAA